MSKIFINIASYRDPTLISTIKDAIGMAKYPQNIVFGLGLQYYDNEMPNFSNFDQQQVKIINYEVDKRPGLVKIRYEISKLMTDEDYFLMIDSHMNFSENWDLNIIKEFNDLVKIKNNKNIVLSGNDKKSLEKNKYSLNIPTLRYNRKYLFYLNSPQINFLQVHEPLLGIEEYQETNIVHCGFFFTSKDFLNNFKLDEYSQFIHEELYLSWKVYMAGGEIYNTKTVEIQQSKEKYHEYMNYAWSDKILRESKFIPVFPDSLEDNVCMFITMVTNLESKYFVKNSNFDPMEFWQKNTINLDVLKQIKERIHIINYLINGNRMHPVNDNLINCFININKYFDYISIK